MGWGTITKAEEPRCRSSLWEPSLTMEAVPLERAVGSTWPASDVVGVRDPIQEDLWVRNCKVTTVAECVGEEWKRGIPERIHWGG